MIQAIKERVKTTLTKPRPKVFIFTNHTGYAYGHVVDPISGREIFALSQEFARRIEDELTMEMGRRVKLVDFAEVEVVSGPSSVEMCYQPEGAQPMSFHTLRIAPLSLGPT